MSGRSFAETMNSVRVMAAGLKANADRVAKRGIGTDFVAMLESLQQKAMNLDSEQEGLKGKLKAKTAEVEATMQLIDKSMSEARKVVKLEMDKANWKEFGIQDKTERTPRKTVQASAALNVSAKPEGTK